MGASSSCKIYQQFSTAISSIAQYHHGINHIKNYLDDYLIISDGLVSGKRDLEMFKSMAASINLPLAHDKVDGPKPVLEFLGIELDCTKMEARLQWEKIVKGKHMIQSLPVHKRSTRKRIEFVHGFLSFCASIIPAGLAFVRSLSGLIKSKWVSLSSQIIHYLQTWAKFVESFNGWSMFVHDTRTWLETQHQYLRVLGLCRNLKQWISCPSMAPRPCPKKHVFARILSYSSSSQYVGR